ncbi:zinc ribbon domain-containing protein [Microseira sp. BLCC-F43]|uniref:zinc ribbon domain-containing protein n=1 Tax=Microseira sp. BLCC-F43 TaxID=3153602 RepID=UPI0035B6CA6B
MASIRQWTCEHCQTNHDRDVNAAININNEALRILSLGTSDTPKVGDVRRLRGQVSCLLDAIAHEITSPNYTASG